MSDPKQTLAELIDHSAQLLAVAELLTHENAQLKARLSQTQAQVVSLEKRLSAARSRIETLIARLPENEQSSLMPDNS